MHTWISESLFRKCSSIWYNVIIVHNTCTIISVYGLASLSSLHAHINLRYSQGTGTIRLTNVQCNPNDILLTNCSHSRFSVVRSCDHSQDVAVTCVQTSMKDAYIIHVCMYNSSMSFLFLLPVLKNLVVPRDQGE